MKNNILGYSAIAAVLVLSFSFANGYNGGNLNNSTNNKNYSNSNYSTNYEELNKQEISDLIYSYREETLAYELYNYFYEKYENDVFKNIANSELNHISKVENLLNTFNIEIPTGFGDLEDEYNELKAKGDIDLKNALEVGMQIEILDIDDIKTIISNTNNSQIQKVFLNIGGASFNHLRSFILELEDNGYSTSIDYSNYLIQDNLEESGSLQYLLQDELLKDGVELENSNGNKRGNSGNKMGRNKSNSNKNSNRNDMPCWE